GFLSLSGVAAIRMLPKEKKLSHCWRRRALPYSQLSSPNPQHPKSRKDNCRNEDKPNSGGVVWNFFKWPINVTEYRKAKDNVNPANNRTFGSITDHLIPFH